MLFQDIIPPLTAVGLTTVSAGTAGVASSAVGAFTAVVASIYMIVKDKEPESSVWEQIESKLENRLRTFSTTQVFDSMKQHWHDMDMIISKKSEDITTEDLERMLTEKAFLFPQIHRTTGYTETWFSVVEAYMWYLSSVFYTLQHNEKLDKCAWARELHVLRKDIIGACTDLAKKRFKGVTGVSYDENYRIRNNKGSFVRLTILDKAVSHSYDNVFMIKYEKEVAGKIEEKLNNALKDFVLRAFNAYVTSKHQIKGCSYPSEIKKEIAFKFRPDFYGRSQVYGTFKNEEKFALHYGSRKCATPCGTYGYKDNWCFTKKAMEGYDWAHDRPYDKEPPGNSCTGIIDCWGICRKPSSKDWDKAYPVPSIQHSRYFQDRMMAKIQQESKYEIIAKKNKKKINT